MRSCTMFQLFMGAVVIAMSEPAGADAVDVGTGDGYMVLAWRGEGFTPSPATWHSDAVPAHTVLARPIPLDSSSTPVTLGDTTALELSLWGVAPSGSSGCPPEVLSAGNARETLSSGMTVLARPTTAALLIMGLGATLLRRPIRL